MGQWHFVRRAGDRRLPMTVSDRLLEREGFGRGRDEAVRYARQFYDEVDGPYRTRGEAIHAAHDANQGIVDHGQAYSEDSIDAIGQRMADAYLQAAVEMEQKVADQLKGFDAENAKWKDDLASGNVTKSQYRRWLDEQAVNRQFVGTMAEALAADAAEVDRLVREYVNDELPQVYAENANYAAYEVESGLGWDTHAFDLYDQSTVRRLIAKQPRLIPTSGIDAKADVRWNRQKLAAAITQGILQGESVTSLSKRLMKVLKMDENASMRAARTAVTSAENAGRVDSYRRAERAGIGLEQQWMATLDERTRVSHRELDGKHVPVGKKFRVDGKEIGYPGDPSAPGELVWNCRCCLVAWMPDIEDEDPTRWSRLPKGMTYEDWKRAKAPRQPKAGTQANGGDHGAQRKRDRRRTDQDHRRGEQRKADSVGHR